eukprot:CAMPEP_0176397466 /NCGR_PEP_ID=MMETSP0126-20121128/45156_1 /TAXON_ID=141414 ORGANISM="Strombidinopsis acuminatum, Strain SPMC142" /NCGR_SAMPLE_ID=MMETSP0126 /ASSEMBLY_ACC=CAM_ASM_000229 /LENGTH=58 /DNA_ID=CAMNT_0017771811 /DNA_START=102 /DNA_END=278 /DNA_ORIENTATION=+
MGGDMSSHLESRNNEFEEGDDEEIRKVDIFGDDNNSDIDNASDAGTVYSFKTGNFGMD